MRKPVLSLPAIALGLIALYLPLHADGAACTADQCLVNSAISQRVQPTSVVNDDKGDSTFFASQSGQLPNVVFVLDNSTSMYELPYDYNPYPNSAWVSLGQTPDGCGVVGTTPSFGPGCTGTTFAQTAASCHANTFFEGLRDVNGAAYGKATTYPVPDPAFSTYFANTNVFKFMEWNTSAPGGVANGGPITFTAGSGTSGGTVAGSVNTDCFGLDPTPGSGGNGGTGANAWSMSQQQRCQQCIDEAGYYIAPGASSNDSASGQILFKGSWLDFYPPKFILARKVLTDFISRQSSAPAPVRIGVVTYDPNNVNAIGVPSPPAGLQAGDGGHFISAGMIPDCSVTSWSGATAQTQQTNLINAVRAISWGTTGAPIATPLAETLFNVGQFFSGDNSYYTNTFGSSWLKTEFTAPTGGNKPLCVSCQLNAVVLITDGQPYGDNNLPQTFRNNLIQCPGATPTSDPCGVDEGNGTANLLDDVTNFLATTDLNASLAGSQTVITFVIGLGLKRPLLDNAAKYGKTSGAIRANTLDDLQTAVNNAIVNIIARATAFSATAIQTLQVGTGSTAFVPRFLPGSPNDPIWEGHLYRFDLFNEFVAGVDKNGDGTLNDVFMVDKDGDIISEDDKGGFYKVKNNAPAVPIWDAGAQLAAAAPGSRSIYTATYNSTTNSWTTLPLPSWDGVTYPPPAAFTSLESYLGIDGTTACSKIQGSMATPIPASYLSTTGLFDRDHCAKAILDYTRGFNVLNELSNTTSVTANRLRMLGDIFHSSPVVVDPPVDQFICSLGLHNQCVSTLYQDQLSSALVTPTPSAQYTVTSGGITKTVDAYEKYWEDHETRQRLVLVGANDGMLHAFDAGLPTTSPPTLNSSVGFRQVVYGSGTGNEVWAFVPPDQLSRLWLMMRDGHQLSMDGDIMVRDVWVDGQPNDKGGMGYANQSLVKQDVEFHTVAVAGERQGGNHFVALDVTDTTTPKMLWMYPPPCSADEQQFGQTYGQFSPRPPPIGPVLLQTSNTAGPANYGYPHTEERWVTFLNGGHSAFNTRGRAAAMVDIYTGQPLFKAAFNPSSTDPNDPALQMRFGFAATAALVDYGRANSFAQDGFFDTGVVGDEGGQIWTFRFGEPGHISATTGLVDNWTFGRAYEPNSAASNDPRYHLPIYTVASNTVESDNGWLRAYVGSGDRAHIRSQGGGDCRPDDPMSCIASGCTVSSSLTLDSGTSHYASTFASGTGTSSTSPVMASPTQSSTATTNACNYGNASETVTVSACPNTAMNFSEPLTFTCSGSPLSCTDGAFKQPTPNANRALATTSPSPTAPGSFVSVAILADATGSPSRSRRMNLPADADTYDTNRLTGCGNAACAANTPSAGLSGDLVDVSATTATTSAVSGNQAGRSSAGWAIRYGTIDEKTATSSTILGGCVIWSSLQPTGGGVGCASAGSSVSPFYQADVVTGAPNCAVSFLTGSTYSRSISRNVISPPPEPAAAVSVGAGGSALRYSTLEIQPGAQQVTQMTVGTSTELLQMLYSLPLSVDQHTCRHVDATRCE